MRRLVRSEQLGVMAKRKLIRFAELETFDNVYQPKFEEISGGEYCLKGKWAERVFGNNNPIVIIIIFFFTKSLRIINLYL